MEIQAQTQPAQQRRPRAKQEVGSSVSGEEKNPFDADEKVISPLQIDEMLRRDAVIKSLYRVIILPILAVGWTIDPYDESDEVAQEQAKKVKNWLSRPSFDGGMTTSFELFREQAFTSIPYGFSVFEIVWQIDDEGYIIPRKIAFRPQRTVKLLKDDRGGFAGVEQKAKIGQKTEDVTIPLEKCLLFTHNKAKNPLYGESEFNTAWRYYNLTNDFYKLYGIQAQYKAVRPNFVEVKNDVEEVVSQEELEDLVEKLQGIRFKGTVGVPKQFEVKKQEGDDYIDIMPFITHLDDQKSRSVLAAFMLLGSNSEYGSWALSKDQSDMFLQSIVRIKKSFDQHVTNYLLPKIYEANFPEPRYGVFKTEDFNDELAEFIDKGLELLISQNRLSDEMLEEFGKLIGQRYELPELEQYTKPIEPLVISSPPNDTGNTDTTGPTDNAE